MPTTIAIDASRAIRAAKTGVEWYAAKLIEALATAAPSAWDVRLLVDRPVPPSTFHLPSSWSTTVLRWPPRYLWSQARLAAHLRRTRPSLFFSPVHVLPFLATSPSVVTIHDVDYVLHPEAFSRKGRAYLRLTTAWAVRRAARILVPSEASKRHLVERFGYDPAKVRVTPLAPVMPAPEPGDAGEIRTTLGLTGPYFLFVGRLETKKNVPRIIGAFREFHAAHPEVRLALVGRFGRGRERVLHALAAADLGDRILLVDRLPPRHLSALMAGAVATVFPSLAEGFGLPILDSFTCRVPVITSRGIATEEVAGDAALLVDPTSTEGIAAAMRRLFEDDALRRSLVERGSERVKEFTWERTARMTVEAFEEVLSS